MTKSTLYILLFICSVASTFGQTEVTFIVDNVSISADQKIGIRGNTEPLSWETSLLLTKQGKHYAITMDFDNSASELEYKFVIESDTNQAQWEIIANRTQTLSKNKKLELKSLWNRENAIDINSLELIPAAALLKDYELVEKMILEVHPGTYRYSSKEEINASLQELKTKFSQPLSYQEAYLALSKVTAQIKCDHTKAGFNNQNKTINSIIHYQADKVPFAFKWVNQEMIVTHNASQNELLQRGGKIISLNGIPVTEIQQQILPYIGADGDRMNNRIYKSEVNAYDFRYNAFDIFYPLIYPLKNETLTLEIIPFKSTTSQSIDVKTLTREARFLALTKRYKKFPKTRDDLWHFDIKSDSIAHLTVNSFGLNGWKAMTIDYKQFLAEAFEKIDKKGIQHLIIDIRENNGGNDEMANELFKYLVATNCDFKREGRTRYKKFPESLKPHIKTWGDNPWYFNLKPKNEKNAEGYYVFEDNYKPSKKMSKYKIYQGKSYLMTSSANTSLAFYTAARFKIQQLGLLIGQETGGNLNDINGGQILFLTLPNSKIEIDFPVMGGFSITPQPSTGVLPDISITYNQEAIATEKDLELEKVMQLIQQ